jgi:hypothetical protein
VGREPGAIAASACWVVVWEPDMTVLLSGMRWWAVCRHCPHVAGNRRPTRSGIRCPAHVSAIK